MPKTDDTEAKMRRSLGLDPTSPASPPADPMKAARQAIRSQVAARDYAERHLAQAQGDIQRLREKLRQARHERDAALETARLAVAAQTAAEQTVMTTEAALASEKAARDRAERSLTNAQTTIRDLQAKLDAAGQALQMAQGELAGERERAITRASVAPEIGGAEDGADAVVRRRPGRPRKTPGAPMSAETGSGQDTSRPSETPKTGPAGRPRSKVVKWWGKG